MNKHNRHTGRIITGAAAILLTLAIPVHAATSIESEGIDRNQKGTITVERAPDSGWPVSGTVIHLYKVADLKDDMTFAYTDEFNGKAKSDILPSPSEKPDSSWDSSTKELMKAVDQDDIEPVKTLNWNPATDNAVFSNLNIGLYLITSDPITYNNTKYVSAGNLVSVPSRNSNTESWKYSYSVEMKHTEETVPVFTPTPEVTPTPTPSITPSPSIKKTPVPSKNPSPEPSSPSETTDTGDHSHTALYAGAFVAMMIVIGIVISIRKEERKN